MNARRDKDTTQAVQRSIDLLEAVASGDGPVGVSALARATGLSKATTHRLCQTLVDRQFLEQDPRTGRYQLGGRLLRISSRMLGRLDLARMSRPILEEMASASGQNAFAGQILDMQEMLICQEVRVDNPVQPRSLLGMRFNLLDAPGGLLCLASLDEKRLGPVLKTLLQRHARYDARDHAELASRIVALRGSALCACRMIRPVRTQALFAAPLAIAKARSLGRSGIAIHVFKSAR